MNSYKKSSHLWSNINASQFAIIMRSTTQKQRNYIYNMVESVKPNIYLDIGCGPGIDFEGLQKKDLDINYIGLDLAPNLIYYCMKRFPSAKLIIASAEQLPFRNNSIDFVICKDLLEHLPNGFEYALKEILIVSSNRIVISWFIPPHDEPTKIGVKYPFNNILHKIYVIIFTLLIGKIQYNIYNKNDILDIISRNKSKLKITKIGKNLNRDTCEVWELTI